MIHHKNFTDRLMRMTLAVCLLLAWTGAIGFRGVTSRAMAADPNDASQIKALGDGLLQYAKGLAAVEPLLDKTRFSPAAVVQAVGNDPAKLAAWVAQNTSMAPYSGCLRGPVGVLMDRRGSSLDRSLLMAELFRLAGAKTRLARGQLPPSQVTPFVHQSPSAQPSGTPNSPADGPTIDRIAAATGIPADQVHQTIQEQQIQSEKAHEDFVNTTMDQTARLMKIIDAAGIKPSAPADDSAKTASLADHWWAQYNNAGTWIDADPAPDGSISPKPACDAIETLDLGESWAKAIASRNLLHEVVIRVRGERSSGKGREEFNALESTFAPAVLAGTPLSLRMIPLNWPGNLDVTAPGANQQLKTTLLAQNSWVPVIVLNGTPIEQDGFDDHGQIVKHPSLDSTGKTGESVVKSTKHVLDAFGAGPAAPPDDGVLTAAWIEYDIRQPGAPIQTIRRNLYDCYGPAARKASLPASLPLVDDSFKLRRSAALTRCVDMLPTGCLLAPDFVSEQAIADLQQGAAAATGPLRESIGGQYSSAVQKILGIDHAPVALLALAALRQAPAEFRSPAAIDVTNVFTWHDGLGTRDDGSITAVSAVDIVANSVSFASADGFSLAVRQGVVETNLEKKLNPARYSQNAAAIFQLSDAKNVQWKLIRTAEDAASLSLSNDAKARIGAELAEGYVVIAPQSPVANGPLSCEEWWRVDPRTGNTLGMGVSGMGDEFAERAIIHARILAVAMGYTTFTSCMGDSQSSVKGLGCAVCGVAAAVMTYFGMIGELGLGGKFGAWAAGYGGAKNGAGIGVLCNLIQ